MEPEKLRSEAELQALVVKELAKVGCDCLALQLHSARGWPDLTVLKRCKTGEVSRPVFLELKIPGGKISKQQWGVSEFLFSHGQVWYCVDSVADAVETVKREFGLK